MPFVFLLRTDAIATESEGVFISLLAVSKKFMAFVSGRET